MAQVLPHDRSGLPLRLPSDEMERAFGYVGARRASEIGPHIFAHYGAVPQVLVSRNPVENTT